MNNRPPKIPNPNPNYKPPAFNRRNNSMSIDVRPGSENIWNDAFKEEQERKYGGKIGGNSKLDYRPPSFRNISQEWIKVQGSAEMLRKCPNCKDMFSWHWNDFTYCPSCGKKLKHE